ncbi:hypothetical protein TcYC6_0086860 [Trypanosoma cruzi]|uniref:Uncharacterized protein n=1 Tax=Trypanosoma cruzi TaxID=5693 RepID=A0A7J6Y7J3_TRYCR|nr:hypothetical protein ECC02_004526 [Trypanosoma cruzi]KAF8296555.1 hypothetical protein TcYC6_0086860 [Trypanosoma cruzi]
MLSATEKWRQCAAMMDNTSKEELLSAAAVAGEKLAADEPTRCTFSDGPQETSNAMLVNALLFLFRQLCAEYIRDADTARQFLLSPQFGVAPQTADVIVEVWMKNGRGVMAQARRRTVADFCSMATCGDAALERVPLFLASRSRVVVAEGNMSEEGLNLQDNEHRVESLLALPATAKYPCGVEVVVGPEEAYMLFCELDKVQAKLDALLMHSQ